VASFSQLYLSIANGQPPEESEIGPQAMYSAVLPYLGPELAAEELEIPPPVLAGEGGGRPQPTLNAPACLRL
jgi:hypothetical protein